MLKGHQSWVFETRPVIRGAAAVGGPFEAEGALRGDFDLLHGDIWLGQDSFEKAERKLLEQATELAIKQAELKKEDIQFFLCGDLMNQIHLEQFRRPDSRRTIFRLVWGLLEFHGGAGVSRPDGRRRLCPKRFVGGLES